MGVFKLKIGRIALFATALFAVPAMATEYWLGTGVNASDDNAGTSKDAPFATWEHAFAAVGAANDNTLNVLPGTYTLSATPAAWTRSGVTIRGVYANGDPITNTTDAARVVIDGDNTYQIAPLGKNPSHLTISGITFQNGFGHPSVGDVTYGDAHYNSISNCVFKDCSGGSALSLTGKGNRLEDCVFCGNTTLGDGSAISGYAACNFCGAKTPGSDTNYVRRCVFEKNGATDKNGTAAIVGRMTEVEGCTFRANIGTGNVALRFIYVASPWVAVVRDCTFVCNTNTLTSGTSSNIGVAAITDNSVECYFDNCHFLTNNTGSGTALHTATTTTTLQGCSFDGNAGIGSSATQPPNSCIHFYQNNSIGYLTNCTFRANGTRLVRCRASGSCITTEECTFHNNDCDQIFFIQGATSANYRGVTNVFRRCTFANNTVHGTITRYGMFQLSVSSFDSCVISNNTSDGNIVSSYGGISMTNCLFASNSVTGKAVDGGDARGVDMFDTGVNHIVNCTFADNSTGRTVVYREVDGDEIVNCIFYNNTTTASRADFLKLSGTSNCFLDYVPRGTWANLVGGTVGADPGFKDAANGDYTLKKKSVCRNAGANATWMTGATDFAGNARINANDKVDGVAIVDIGCYEWYRSNRGLMMVFR